MLKFSNLLPLADFMPHGYCYQWDAPLVWLHVVSDSLITLAYYCIPVVLVYFVRKRRDVPFHWLFLMFGSFILACGTTHLMEIWNVWHASYLLAGVIKALTATVSVVTAAALIPLVPRAVALPSLLHLQEKNRRLEEEIAESKRNPQPYRPHLSGAAMSVLTLSAFGVLALMASGQHDHPALHTVLDTGMFVLSGLLAWLFWDIGVRSGRAFAKGIAISFALTSLAEFIHASSSLEWPSILPAILQPTAAWRAATWLPAAHLLSIGILLSVCLLLARGQQTAGLALALTVIAGGLFFIFRWLPRYTPPGWLGITRPSVIFVPVLWALAAGACWRLRTSDRMLPALTLMALGLIVSNLFMLFSSAPHDTEAMVAHLGRVGAYLALLLSLMQMASFDMLERIRSERELARLNEELEGRVLERTSQLRSANRSLQNEIAERAQTERALREAKGRMTGIIASAMDSVITVDSRQQIILFNAAAEHMFRCSSSEAIGHSIERFIPSRFRAAHAEHIRKFGEAGITNRAMGEPGTLWALRSDGEEFRIEASISQTDTGGERLYTVILRDITERIRAEEGLRVQETALARSRRELLEQTNLLQSVLDSMGEGLVAADRQGVHPVECRSRENPGPGRGENPIPGVDWALRPLPAGHGHALPGRPTPPGSRHSR